MLSLPVAMPSSTISTTEMDVPLMVAVTPASVAPQTSGGSIILTCTASGGTGEYAFRWWKDGVPITHEMAPSMDTTSSLLRSPLVKDHTGSYTCSVTSGSMNVDSNTVTIIVNGESTC